MLCMINREGKGHGFTHRAGSSPGDDRCNSWTAVPEIQHRGGAPSPCCPFFDAGLSWLKHCNQTEEEEADERERRDEKGCGGGRLN